MQPSAHLHIISFNTRAGHDAANVRRPDGAPRLLGACRWDVALLQEVDQGTLRNAGLDQTADWADTLAVTQRLFHPVMDWDGGRYGLAILSRLRIEDVRSADLAVPGAMEPRRAVAVRIRPADGPLCWVVTTHLGLDETERTLQFPRLAAFLAALTGPVVIAGDFNTAAREDFAPLHAAGFDEPPGMVEPTYPAPTPTARIDRMACNAGCIWREARRIVSPGLADVSDHLPIYACLEVLGR